MGGAGDGPLESDAMLDGRDVVDEIEARPARWEKNEPMFAPQVPNVDGGGLGGSGWASCCAPTMLRGLRPRIDVGVGGTSLFLGELPRDSRRNWCSLAGGEEEGSLVTEEDELGLRCIHRSRTPATALKKLVEPAAMVRETASRAGASCWSSLSS